MLSCQYDKIFQDLNAKHEPRYFAMLNNAVAVAETNEFEGGNVAPALEYYGFLLQLNLPNFPIQLTIDAEHEALIQYHIQRLIEFNTIKVNNPSDLDKLVKEAISLISETTKHKASCYYPSGWQGEAGSHFAGLKFRHLDNGNFAVSLINLGGGMMHHRPLTISGSMKNKRCYQSEEYEIDLFSHECHDFLRKIIELRHLHHNDEKLKPYDEHDLYGLLILLGNKLPQLEKITEKSVTPQRTGTCTITNLEAVAKDILVDCNVDHDARKRFHFVVKLRSLLFEFYQYRQGLSSIKSLQWALNEFAVRVNKFYKTILSGEEVIKCQSLHQEMQQRLHEDKARQLEEKCKAQAFPSVEFAFELKIPEFTQPLEKKKEPIPIDMHDEEGEITPNNVASIIETLMRKRPPFEELYGFFKRLFFFVLNEQPGFWQQVSEENYLNIISHFEVIERLNLNDQQCLPKRKAQGFALAVIIYDIVAEIIPRIEASKFGDRYTLALDDIHSEESFYCDPQSFYIIKHIIQNFKIKAKNKARVFSNSVGFKENEYDKSIDYVVNELLDESQRRDISQKVLQEKDEDYGEVSDEEIFSYLIRKNQESALPKYIRTVITLACTAHGLGYYGRTYDYSKTKKIWYFHKSQFYHELSRLETNNSYLRSTMKKHLPEIKINQTIHQDFSENTIFHPRNQLQEEFRNTNIMGKKYSNAVTKFPYQIFLSGSINPNSKIWQVKSEDNQFFEQLNEALRQLECSPNLQVVRALAWGQNNFKSLNIPEVQERIFSLIFQYGKLDTALAKQFDTTVSMITAFIKKGLDYCYQDKLLGGELLAWFTEVTAYLKDYVKTTATLYGYELEHIQWPNCQSLLEEKILMSVDNNERSNLALNWLSLIDASEITTSHTSAQLLVMRLIANLGEFGNRSNETWDVLAHKIQQWITQNPKNFMHELETLLESHLNINTSQLRLGNTILEWENSNFKIDLMTGRLISHSSRPLKDCTEKIFKQNEALFHSLNLRVENITLFFDEKNSEVHSSSGSWFFEVTLINEQDGFHYKIDKITQSITINGFRDKFLYLSKEKIGKLFNEDNKNPFEYGDEYYNYWAAGSDPNLLFIQQPEKTNSYLYSLKTLQMIELVKQENAWEFGNTILLNLVNPQIAIEQDWSNRLKPVFGFQNVKITASRKDGLNRYAIVSIEHLLLRLNFEVAEDGSLLSREFLGLTVSENKSLKALHGFSGVICLENLKGRTKIIIPAFGLNKGEKNNAFNTDNIMDYSRLCHPSHPYYAYELDSNGELVAKSMEANLYLALLYRSLGDFKKAINYLYAAKHYENINENGIKIILEILQRKIISPMAAAFDIKLHLFLEEHSKKWSSDANEPFEKRKLTDEWYKWQKQQRNFYRQSHSNYKKDVSILPLYCRLSRYELNCAGFATDLDLLRTEATVLNKRLQAIAKLPNSLLTKNGWSNAVDSIMRHVENNNSSEETIVGEPIHLRVVIAYNVAPTLTYLVYNFKTLFNEAISQDKEIAANFKKKLFLLLQNEKKPLAEVFEFLTLLNFCHAHPEYFNQFQPIDDRYDLILAIGKILQENNKELKNSVVPLFDDSAVATKTSYESRLKSDYEILQLKFSIGEFEYLESAQQPFNAILGKYFVSKLSPLVMGEFQLDNENFEKTASLLEKKIMARYKKGHKTNQENLKNQYTNKSEKTLRKLKNKLLKIQSAFQKISRKLEAELISMANDTPFSSNDPSIDAIPLAHNLELSRANEQRPKITIEDVFSAFLQQDPSLLSDKNPFLTQKVMDDLFAGLVDVCLVHCAINQGQEALDIIGDNSEFDALHHYEMQQLASVLNKKRNYDIHAYPEFLIYEYATKRLLRDDQVKILKDIIAIIENENVNSFSFRHALLQFAAGGGKTSVLLPILAQRFSKKDFLPVIFNTNELYDIGLKEIPKNLRGSFNQNIEVIERGLDHKWISFELYKLHTDLKRWQKEGKCLLLTAVTWHSINICWKQAVIKDDINLKHAADAVLQFFRWETVKLEDESHIISDPLQQCIKTDDDKRKLPAAQVNLLLRFYDYLLNHDQTSLRVAKFAGIKNNKKRLLSEKELTQLQTSLVNLISTEKAFAGLDSDKLLHYLTKSDRQRPPWLLKIHECDEPLADLIVFARAFIKTHLPFILKQQYGKDFGISIHDGDLTAAPKHEGKDVTSHFADPSLVAALTIQLYYLQGLCEKNLKRLFSKFITDHHLEHESAPNRSSPTEVEQLLLELIPGEYDFSCFEDFSLALQIKLIGDPIFYKNPKLVKVFLTSFALKQIEVPSHRITSTAADLQAGFSRSVLFSATPGLIEFYPSFLTKENCFFEKSFEAKVIDTLLQLQNSGSLVLKKTQSIEGFFKQFPIELLQKMTGLIDRGALLTEFKVTEVIEYYLDKIAPKSEISSVAYFNEKHLNFRSKASNIKDLKIEGSALAEALEEQGLDPKKFLLFLFLDLSKTNGTDTKRPFTDHAGLTVGKFQTVTETIQAAMRERQLLEEDAQSITWIMFKSLYNEIHPDSKSNKFDPKHVFYWMIANEAVQAETKIINRAFQGILQAITEYVYINHYNFELTGLVEKLKMSPWDIYEIDSTLEDCEFVLRQYLNGLLKQFSLEYEDLSKTRQSRIEIIIDQTSKLIPKLENPPKASLNDQVQQEQQTFEETEEEQEQQQKLTTRLDEIVHFNFSLEQYHENFDSLESVFCDDSDEYQLLRLPTCNGIRLPDLLINGGHFQVMEPQVTLKETNLRLIKPIKMLLLQITPEQAIKYLAVTSAGAEFYSFLMTNSQFSLFDPAYALVTLDGDVLHTSSNFSAYYCQQLLKCEDCQSMLAYTHLLNGSLWSVTELAKVVLDQKWSFEQFNQILAAISLIHVSQMPIASFDSAYFYRLCGWSDDYGQPNERVHKRYEPKPPRSVSIPFQKLQVEANSFSNQVFLNSICVSRPKTKLEGYLFGKIPMPCDIDFEKLEFEMQANSILATNYVSVHTNKLRNKAIIYFQQMVKQLLDNPKSYYDNLTYLESFADVFHRFLNLMDSVEFQFKEFDGSLISVKKLREHADIYLDNAYTQYIHGKSIDVILDTLYQNIVALEKASRLQSTNPLTKLGLFKIPSGNTFENILKGIQESISGINEDRTFVRVINQ